VALLPVLVDGDFVVDAVGDALSLADSACRHATSVAHACDRPQADGYALCHRRRTVGRHTLWRGYP
jgi:hypothetical protein